MILNHASVFAKDADRESIDNWLVDLAIGLAGLVKNHIVESSLRMAVGFHDTSCLPGYTLHDACQSIRIRDRDQYTFLMRLATKSPILSDIAKQTRSRFLACEEQTLGAEIGAPLLLCAVMDGIAVGFPSDPEWDRDQITVRFLELLPDESMEATSEQIDQLTRSSHLNRILSRYRNRRLADQGPAGLWKNRKILFPNLSFGPDVENNLQEYANHLSTIAGKLVALDIAARQWNEKGGPAPHWETLVTTESSNVRKNPNLREARRFRSHLGTQELFFWHARFGGGRIHLRLEPKNHDVEIGYIGVHLPLR